MDLEDVDVADDHALRSQTQQHMQEKTSQYPRTNRP